MLGCFTGLGGCAATNAGVPVLPAALSASVDQDVGIRLSAEVNSENALVLSYTLRNSGHRPVVFTTPSAGKNSRSDYLVSTFWLDGTLRRISTKDWVTDIESAPPIWERRHSLVLAPDEELVVRDVSTFDKLPSPFFVVAQYLSPFSNTDLDGFPQGARVYGREEENLRSNACYIDIKRGVADCSL